MQLSIEEKKMHPIKKGCRVIEFPVEQEDVVDYVSPYMILNNTGYMIEIDPNISTAVENGPNQAIIKPLKLDNGKQVDLLMETKIEGIFDSSIKDNIFAKTEVRLRIHHPSFGIILIEDIEINTFGSKLIRLSASKGGKVIGEFQIICDVKHQKNKKLVHFSSPILFKNELNDAIVV